MKAAELEKMRAVGEDHWWFLGRRYLVRALLGSCGADSSEALILDAGRGTGIMAKELARLGTVVGVDVAEEAIRRGGVCATTLLCTACIEALPFSGETFEFVVGLDVLEHVERDTSAVRELYRVCKPGGRLLIAAPAYNWLWSKHDEALDHRRRYSAGDLRMIVSEAGFTVCRLSYAVTALFPLAALFRLARRFFGGVGSDLFSIPRVLNWILARLMQTEAAVLRHLSLPFGLSVVTVAVKRRGTDLYQ